MAEIPFWAQLGIGALAVGALLLGHRRLWVFGWQFRAVEIDRDFWRDLSLRLLKVNDKAIDVAAEKVQPDA